MSGIESQQKTESMFLCVCLLFFSFEYFCFTGFILAFVVSFVVSFFLREGSQG